MTHRGTVKTGTLCDTNVPRLFVAGDASHDAQFVVVAASEGVKAAVAVNTVTGGGAEAVSLKAVSTPQPIGDRGWVWNFWGMLLAVPMLMVLKAVCDHVEDLKPVGELLGE